MAGGVRVFEPPPDPALGPEIDTVEVVVDGEVRQRQRVVLAPPQDGSRLPVDIEGANITGTFNTIPSVASTVQIPSGPLAANAVFVGAWEDVLDYAAIQVAIFTDAASAQNGAVVEFSHDGVNPIRAVPTTIPAGFAGYFHLAPQARFVRFRYTNGPTAQTVMRVSVLYAHNTPGEVVQPLGSGVTDANVATVVRAMLGGLIMSGPSTGAYAPLGTDGTGRLMVVDSQLEDAGGETATGVRGWLRRIWERLALVVVRDEIAFYASAAGGRMAFNVTTQLVTISGTGEHNLALLVNPADSLYDAYLDVGEFGASANTTFRRIRNATVTLANPSAGNPSSNMGGGSAVSPLRMYRGGNFAEFTYTGGTVAKTAHIAAFQQYLTQPKGRVILRPGQSLLWSIQGNSALGASLTASVFFEYWLRPKEVV